MNELEKVYGIPKEVELTEEMYQNALKECDFSEKLTDGRSPEEIAKGEK